MYRPSMGGGGVGGADRKMEWSKLILGWGPIMQIRSLWRGLTEMKNIFR